MSRPYLCDQCGAEYDEEQGGYCGCSWYVNVYKRCQVYGGPEEGGWWYHTTEAIESHLVWGAKPWERAEQIKRGLERRYRDWNKELKADFWGKYDEFVVLVERKFAEHDLASRHYE